MDDLDFIKKDVQKHLNEGMVFNDCGAMLKSLMVAIHNELENIDYALTDGDIVDIKDSIDNLKTMMASYATARVR